MSEDSNIDFVACHYRKGRFSADKAWKSLGIGPANQWHRFKVAAAVAVIVVLSATAALVYNRFELTPKEQSVQTPADVRQADPEEVRIIDFEETPLPAVVDRIKDVYGVEIENLPVDAELYKLSLRYEGTADDLVETINDILGTDMIILWP